jgi:hypothetical protein
MPSKLSLEPYKNKILSWVSEKPIYSEILSKIRVILYIEYSLTTLEYTFRTWNILRNRKNRSPEIKRIKLCISELFTGNYNNNIILQVFSVKGIPLYY